MAGASYTWFIAGAYGSAAAIVAGLIAWIALDRRHLNRLISELEAKGMTRRTGRVFEEDP